MTSGRALGWLAGELAIFVVASALLNHGQEIVGSVLLSIGVTGLVGFSILRRSRSEGPDDRRRQAPAVRQTQQALIYAGIGITYYFLGRMAFFHDHLLREILLAMVGVVIVVLIWRSYQT